MSDDQQTKTMTTDDILRPAGSEDGAHNTSGVQTIADAKQRAKPAQTFDAGEKFGDFIIIKPLGKGGFATVYLALDVQLGRRIALKISNAEVSIEGKVLAELEHLHIVQVYAQFTEPTTNKYCLCLQYVPGTTLADLIEKLHEGGRRPASGQEILDAIRTESGEEVSLDYGGLRNREILVHCSFDAAVCRIGRQLAEALQFAHHRGVLHCDIKPANVLVNPYGRPLLADFNVSVHAEPDTATRPGGGTLSYMPPEQLAMLMREPGQKVDERSDIYSLGVLLFELYTGRRPFELVQTETFNDRLKRLRDFRPDLPWEEEKLPPVLERVLRRCLDPEPANRYPDAGALAVALTNAFDLLNIERKLPAGGRPTRWALRAPTQALVVLLLLPHIVSTVFNIAYNSIEIRLTPEQKVAFFNVILGYNAIIYPLAIVLMLRRMLPVVRGWKSLDTCGSVAGSDIDRIRKASLTLSTWAIVLALAGWVPGGLVFPLAIDLQVGNVPWIVYGQFLLSFTVAGLIALIYTYFGSQFVVLRVIYPKLGNPDTYTREESRRELAQASRWFGTFQVLAGAVPLVGAVLLVVVTSGEMTLEFRLLMVSLIVLGMVGVGLAVNLTRRLTQITATLEG